MVLPPNPTSSSETNAYRDFAVFLLLFGFKAHLDIIAWKEIMGKRAQRL